MNALLFALLLPALILTESSGNPSPKDGDGGKAIGILQIHRGVVTDVNEFYHTTYRWPEDCRDPATSKEICRLYLGRYATAKRLGHEPTMQDMARIWNGGPNGYKKNSTLGYWQLVRGNLK